MTKGKIEFGDLIVGSNRNSLLSALDLSVSKLDERCPIKIVSTGYSKVIIGIKNCKQLNDPATDLPAFTNLSKVIWCNGYYVFTFDSSQSDIFTYGRMLAPAIGVNEYPTIGNANGPLEAYLVQHKLVRTDGNFFKFKAKQGEVFACLS